MAVEEFLCLLQTFTYKTSLVSVAINFILLYIHWVILGMAINLEIMSISLLSNSIIIYNPYLLLWFVGLHRHLWVNYFLNLICIYCCVTFKVNLMLKFTDVFGSQIHSICLILFITQFWHFMLLVLTFTEFMWYYWIS